MSATKTDELCPQCSKIRFDEISFDTSADLPAWANCARHDFSGRSTCPLCRLIQFTIEVSADSPSNITSIKLRWESSDRKIRVLDHKTSLHFVREPSSTAAVYKVGLPVSGSMIDLQRARFWLDFCTSKHQACNLKTASYSQQGKTTELVTLRVIDVVSKCIAQVKMPCKYVTLSYVWGGVANFRLTSNNQAMLSQPGILTQVWMRIPRTIRDAIEAVQTLGEKYLWVDSLCLIQNDHSDMQRGIAIMDLIYENALFSIIAAGSSHANTGIAGVGSTSRIVTQRLQQITPNIALACHIDVEHLLKQTTYNRRGWT